MFINNKQKTQIIWNPFRLDGTQTIPIFFIFVLLSSILHLQQVKLRPKCKLHKFKHIILVIEKDDDRMKNWIDAYTFSINITNVFIHQAYIYEDFMLVHFKMKRNQMDLISQCLFLLWDKELNLSIHVPASKYHHRMQSQRRYSWKAKFFSNIILKHHRYQNLSILLF